MPRDDLPGPLHRPPDWALPGAHAQAPSRPTAAEAPPTSPAAAGPVHPAGPTDPRTPPVVESRWPVRRLERGPHHGDRSANSARHSVERLSRYLYIVALPEGHGADAVTTALGPVLPTIPAPCRRTLTWDQGGGMANHQHYRPLLHRRRLLHGAGQPLAKTDREEHQRAHPTVFAQAPQCRPHHERARHYR